MRRSKVLSPTAVTALLVFCTLLMTAVQATAQTTWSTAANGDWNDGTKWSAGVPTNNVANLTPTTASYAVTVDAPPEHPFTDLTVQNAVGNTTTLDINATGLTSTNGLLTFGRGAVVNVNPGGELRYMGGPLVSTQHFILSIRDGGVWRLDGGTANFTDLPLTAGRQYLYVGTASSGRLEIVSGTFDLTSVAGGSATAGLFIGAGADGRGYMEMQGGTCRLQTAAQGSFFVGTGNRSRGEVLLTGDASLEIWDWTAIGSANNCTGLVTVAGNATMKMHGGRHRIGSFLNSLGVLTVEDNGHYDGGDTDHWVGGYDNNQRGGKGIINVKGGTAEFRTLNVGYGYKGEVPAYGDVNVSDGWLNVKSHFNVGYAREPNALGRGVLNVSGGLVTVLSNPFVLGYSEMEDTTESGYQTYGTLNLSKGTITNANNFIIGRAFGATGEVFQTGGAFHHVPTSIGNPLKIGWNGGVGTYVMSNGTFETSQNVYVGGGGYWPADSNYAGTGTLHIAGGTFTLASTRDLYVGQFGQGTVTVGGGTLAVRNLNLASQDATLGFEFSAGDIGACNVSGTLTIDPDANLEIDATGATSNVKYTLVSCTARSGSFDIANISVLGGDPAWVDQDTDQNIYFTIPAGTIIMLR